MASAEQRVQQLLREQIAAWKSGAASAADVLESIKVEYTATKDALRGGFAELAAAVFREEQPLQLLQFMLCVAVHGMSCASAKGLMLTLFKAVELSENAMHEAQLQQLQQLDERRMSVLASLSVQLVQGYGAQVEIRYIVRAFESLRVLHCFLEGTEHVAHEFVAKLLEKQQLASLVRLLPFLWRFANLGEVYHTALAEPSLESVAGLLLFLRDNEEAAAAQGIEVQLLAEQTVEHACSVNKFTRAAQICKEHQLIQYKEQVSQGLRTERVTSLLRALKWQLAVKAASGDFELLKYVYTNMLESDLVEESQEVIDMHPELRAHVQAVTPERLEQARQQIREAYLQMPISDSSVIVVANHETLAQAREVLDTCRSWAASSFIDGTRSYNVIPMVGLDTEWPPSLDETPREDVKAATLQVATATHALIFDFVQLSQDRTLLEEADLVLTSLMEDDTIIKLGFAFHSADIKMLARWDMQFSNHISSLLEITALAAFAGREHRHPSLTTFCETYLNKPLRKTQQCSDWERRPLLPSQVRYAALDALCLVAIADVLLQEMKSEFRSGGLAMFNSQSFEPRPLPVQNGDWRKHCREDWLTILSHRKKLHIPAGRPSAKAAKAQPAQNKLKQVLLSAEAEPELVRQEDVLKLVSQKLQLSEADVQSRIYHMDFSEVIGDTTTPEEKVPDIGCGSESQECQNYPLASSLPNFPGHFLLTKTVVVRMDAFLVAVVLPFGRTVDFRKLAEHLSARRRSTRLATPEECAVVLGQRVGEIAPFCYRHSSLVRVIVDRSVTLDKRFVDSEGPTTTLTVFTGCAISSCAILLSPAELMQLTGASELDCARFDEAAPEAAPVSYPIHAQDLTPAIEMRFIVDRMLARLGAWLRMLGCDVEILQSGEELPEMQNLMMDTHRALIAHALATDRVLLSRDRNLFSTAFFRTAEKQGLRSQLITANKVDNQLDEVSTRFGLKFSGANLLTRCSKCNHHGFRFLSKEDAAARGRVPERLIEIIKEFWECGGCGKIYWEGPKFATATKTLSKYVSEVSDEEEQEVDEDDTENQQETDEATVVQANEGTGAPSSSPAKGRQLWTK